MIGICATGGTGHWSHRTKVVSITNLDIVYLNDDTLSSATYGELYVFFDPKSWNVDNDGLIYTDQQWLKDFKKLLTKKGFSARAVEAIEYSELGAQGIDYVSLEVGDPFLIECDRLSNFAAGGKPKKVEITLYGNPIG